MQVRRVISWVPVILLILSLGVVSLSHASTKQLTCTPASVTFYKIPVGESKSFAVAMSNAGTTVVTVSQMKITGSAFKVSGLRLPLKLAADQSIQFEVSFTPIAVGDQAGAVTFTSNASNSQLTVNLRGMSVAAWSLMASPATVLFGDVQVGNQLALPVVLTNKGAFTVTLSRSSLKGGDFRATGIKLPLTISPGASFTFNIVFAPQSSGFFDTSFSVTGPAEPLLRLSLKGAGSTAAQLTVTPPSINFGTVAVGGSATNTGTLTASGGTVTVSSATSSSSDFTLGGISLPATIGAGQSVPFSVTFGPVALGTVSATLSFNSNAGNSPTSQSLSGTGTAPVVVLSWTASTSPVVGYNIYRHGPNGSYVKINSNLDPDTTYNDSSVASGGTYYYATTAVNSSGQESTYSNQVKVVIP